MYNLKWQNIKLFACRISQFMTQPDKSLTNFTNYAFFVVF